MGLVAPGAFIDVAEESGLIVPISRWVLREACHQAVAWRAAGWPELVMAVNLSGVHFHQRRVAEDVRQALADSGLDPHGLELELTESILLHGEDSVVDTVAQWKALGIQLSIDDFGTGYSNLAYLKRFQVDKLKIDRSFIAEMAESDLDRAIVQAIIDMARGLNLRTIAEGVEDAPLASQLSTMGCDEAQGYLWAKPLPADELERWLRHRDSVCPP
jgi:EAL domain-containing protein (putative c-di-GMP-specific phosphodiesterase class I)